MTSLALLLWIVGGIALQVAVYLCIAFVGHRKAYRNLQHVVADSGLGAEPEAPVHHATPDAKAWSGYRTFVVSRRQTENTAGDICSFELVHEDGAALPPFQPGQFLTFQLDMPNGTGATEPLVRCYSLSDAPHAQRYRVSIKRVPAPAQSAWAPGKSSNYFHDHIGEGSRLQVRAPAGHFFLDGGTSPVVLVAGGIGITPMLSMLNWCAEHQPGREVWLFYGVRNGTEVAMRAHLEQLASQHSNFHLHVCFSNPAESDLHAEHPSRIQRHASRVDVALLRSLLPLKPYHFYICGPTAMLQSLVPALDDWGVPDAHIHFEAFGPASIPRKQKPAPAPDAALATPVTVAFAKSGKRAVWTPGSGNLLAFAEAHGIAVNSGCRAGSCGSCHTQIQSGEVAYNQAPDFDPEPGGCLLCVTTPKTDVALEV